MSTRLTGLIAAPHTPFHTDGSLNLQAIERQAQLLIQSDVQGAFVAGTTGEGLSLSMEERQELARRWVDVASGTDLKVILQVGHNSLPEAKTLAKHAGELGADAISALAPSYFKPGDVQTLVDLTSEIAAEAPETPFYLYDIPGMTGLKLSMVEYLERGAKQILTLSGLKYSNPDLMQLQECLSFDGGRYDVLFGCDEALLAAMALGVRGAVGSTYNFAAPLYQRMIQAFESGDLTTARQEQRRAVAMIRTMYNYGFLPASKSVMTLLGVDCGPMRSPLPNLSDEVRQELWQKIEQMNVLAKPLQIEEAQVSSHPIH